MAPAAIGFALGLPDWPDYLEIEQLKLTADYFPLPCSLRELVLQRYADPGRPALGAQGMTLEELIGYLGQTNNLAITPLASILALTEAIGDPALPTAEQTAILHWVGTAFDNWEQQFPLEQELASQLRRLKPLAAALALADPAFLTPGDHPLHQILDYFQLGSVGWQPSLGRAGLAQENRVKATATALLAWFDNDSTDLEAICSEVIAVTERDLARARRMTRRLIETEQGRIKTEQAKRRAADTINRALREYRVPTAIGEFIKGPWYESAQLILLKFGPDSAQWQQMSTTTDNLLNSMQPPEADDTRKRQQLFDMVAQLPRELKRWLISLQHDQAALDDAVGLIEYAHLGILRNQPLELEQTSPLAIADCDVAEQSRPKQLKALREGQWFEVREDSGDVRRVQLVMRMDDSGRLLFTSPAGGGLTQQGFEEFARLLDSGRAARLDCGASFSRSLASAGGVETLADLAAIPGAAAEQARRIQERKTSELEASEERQEPPGIDPEADGMALKPVNDAHNQQAPAGEDPLHLPTGVWLGFHDGDTPLLAKLAVHDRKQDRYTFVNRSGIKMRQLNGAELRMLIDEGLIDILESKSSFRDEISRVKRQSD